MAGSLVVTGLRPALAGYLDLRRGLGFKLDRDAKLLDQFITYLEQRGTGTITVTDALAWATLPANASPGVPIMVSVLVSADTIDSAIAHHGTVLSARK